MIRITQQQDMVYKNSNIRVMLVITIVVLIFSSYQKIKHPMYELSAR